MTLSSVIAKLEKAEAGSRELDAEICRAVYPDCFKKWNNVAVSEWWLHDDKESWGCNTIDGWRHERCIKLARYTTSLDAALSLVQPRFWLNIRGSGSRWFVQVRHNTDLEKEATVVGATSAALATCIAALRARSGR